MRFHSVDSILKDQGAGEMHYLHVSLSDLSIDIFLKELYKLIKTIRIIIDSSGEKEQLNVL